MDRIVSLLLTPHSALVLVAIGAGGLAMLLFLLGRRRRSGSTSRVIGPGEVGAVVYRAADAANPRAPSFLVELAANGERREVLPRGAFLVSPRLGPHRGELRVGDQVLVDGVEVAVPRGEQLYRQAGCQLALDALALVRFAPRRDAALSGAAAVCLALAILATGGAILPDAVDHASERGYLPASILRAGRELTAAGLTCPPGARLHTELRDSTLPGFLHRCRLGTVDHGPFVERDLTGLLRRAGSYRLGRRTGRWIEQLPLECHDCLLRVRTYSEDMLDGPVFDLTRHGEDQTGSYHAGARSGWWERRRDGEVLSAGSYVRGVKDGWWWEEGNHGSYRRGKRQGAWVLIDERLGQELLLGAGTTYCQMVDDAKQGPARMEFADGRYAVGQFLNNGPDGQWTIWSATGRKLLESEYRDGRRVRKLADQNPALAIGQNGRPP